MMETEITKDPAIADGIFHFYAVETFPETSPFGLNVETFRETSLQTMPVYSFQIILPQSFGR